MDASSPYSAAGSAPRILQLAPREAARAAEWADALRTFNPDLAHALKREGAGGVFAARLAGLDVVVKIIPLSPWARVKALLRQSRGWRQWHGTATLESLRIPTALTLALATRSSPPAQLLVLEALPGRSLLHHLKDASLNTLPIRQERRLVNGLARTIGRLHALGFCNRDGKPSNLIVLDQNPSADALSVAVIDAVAIHPAGADAPRALARMLASLIIEPSGCRIPIRQSLRRRTLRAILAESWASSPPAAGDAPDEDFARWERQSARHFWRITSEIIATHRNAKPKIDPLAPPPTE